ncbi:hypothetical protein J2I47_06825 [Fibrella sp. HMF5335]|uniref:Uncharacterized protein n=1 Tax=Fibrella rubiginis TaxID=2817060 RepID=A0A939GDA9_9BACT|nr:hypothetical protein [Fibrella rubiginis]MBO0936256.1 hypothetical protein [Fibrella rubiginis]
MINYSNENVLMDDANSPDLNRKLMGIVSADFVKVADSLKEASYQIRKRGFSDYPVFVASNTDVAVGQLLFSQGNMGNELTYKATYVDEFIERQLIAPESLELWRENYKNADEYCCLFVVLAEFTGFVYIPYPED